MKKAVGNKKKNTSDTINPLYWYDDKDNSLVLQALLKSKQLQLSQKSTGIVQDQDENLHLIDKCSFSIATSFVLTKDTEETIAKFDLLTAEISHIKEWNQLQLSKNNLSAIIQKHKILLPLKLYDAHWVVLEIILQFDSLGFCLSQSITTNIYDSSAISKMSYIARIQVMLDKFLCNFNLQPTAFSYAGKIFTTKLQTDASSCGPITCKTILDLVTGNIIPDAKPKYTALEIISLRTDQSEAVNDPAFVAKQQNYVVAELPAKKINGDVLDVAQRLREYIAQNGAPLLNDEFAIMRDFITADRNLYNANHPSGWVTVSQLLATQKDYKEQLSKVKDWFRLHYTQLRELNLLQNFFETPADKAQDADLVWIDNGRDTLVAVLRKMLSQSAEDNDAKDEPIQNSDDSDPINDIRIIVSMSKKVLVHDRLIIYTCDGCLKQTDSEDNYVLTDCEEYVDNIYKYHGRIANGIKVGPCLERYNHENLKVTTQFNGQRDNENGKLLGGKIQCFMGTKMPNEYYVFCDGYLQNGRLHGLTQIFMVNQKHQYGPINAIFNTDSVELEVPQQRNDNILTRMLSSLSFSAASRKIETEVLLKSFQMIKEHIAENCDKLVVTPPAPEKTIASIRADILKSAFAKAAEKQNSGLFYAHESHAKNPAPQIPAPQNSSGKRESLKSVKSFRL